MFFIDKIAMHHDVDIRKSYRGVQSAFGSLRHVYFCLNLYSVLCSKRFEV